MGSVTSPVRWRRYTSRPKAPPPRSAALTAALFLLSRLRLWRGRWLAWGDPSQHAVKRIWRLISVDLPRHLLELGGLLRCCHFALHEQQSKPGHGLRNSSWQIGSLIGLICLLGTANASVDRAPHGCVKTVRMIVSLPNSGSTTLFSSRFAFSSSIKTGPSAASGTPCKASARTLAALTVFCEAVRTNSIRNPRPCKLDGSGLAGEFHVASFRMPRNVCDNPTMSSPFGTDAQSPFDAKNTTALNLTSIFWPASGLSESTSLWRIAPRSSAARGPCAMSCSLSFRERSSAFAISSRNDSAFALASAVNLFCVCNSPSSFSIVNCCERLIPSSNSNSMTVAPASTITPTITRIVGLVHKLPARAASQMIPNPTANPPPTARRISTRCGVAGSTPPERNWPIYVEILATLILILFGAGFLLVALCRPAAFGDYIRDKPMSPSYLPSDRPESGARRYLARFFGFVFGAALPCGFGGVLSILRNTSSALAGGLDFSSTMTGV
jgi:hypothetical protein